MLIPRLLCKVGFEGTLFLMSSGEVLEEHFKRSGNLTVPACLRKEEARSFVTKQFVDLRTSTQKGQLGAVLYFLSQHRTQDNDWQIDFANGLLTYCQTEGFGTFAQYVFHHAEDFFKGQQRMQGQLSEWKGQCFAEAFITELTKNRSTRWLTQEIKGFKKLWLKQGSVNRLYKALAQQQEYTIMDEILSNPSKHCSKPSVAAENFALQTTLHNKNYPRAKEMLARKTGNRPEQNILDTFTTDAANKRKWSDVDEVLANMYDESTRVPQTLTDDLFVCAVAHQNHEYFGLLTEENSFVVLTGENWAYDHPSPTAFDRGLLETVRLRNQTMFDHLLEKYEEKLSETGLRSALEQAGKPSEKTTDSLFNFDITLTAYDNHYQERLKKKLGIPTSLEAHFASLLTPLKYTPITFDPSQFFIKIDEASISNQEGDPKIASLPQQLDGNNAES